MPIITEDDGSLAASILHDNQPNPRDPTPRSEHDIPDEEECTELCVRDNRRASAHEFGFFGNLLSLVPANHNSMPLGQQQAVNSAVDDVLLFYELMCTMLYQNLCLRAVLGVTDGISNIDSLRHFLQSNTILKSKQKTRGQKQEVTNPTDLQQGILRAAFEGFGVRLHHAPQLMQRHLDKQLHPVAVNALEEGREGVNHSIQPVNSNKYTMNIAAHRKHQKVESIFRLSEIGLDVEHDDQDYHGSVECTNDDYIFDHEAFRACGGPSQAVVEELD